MGALSLDPVPLLIILGEMWWSALSPALNTGACPFGAVLLPLGPFQEKLMVSGSK